MWLITQRRTDPRFRSFYAGPPIGKRTSWWIGDIEKAQLFVDRDHAQNILKKLKFNQPEVVSLTEARNIVAKQKELSYTADHTRIPYDRSLSPIQRQPAGSVANSLKRRNYPRQAKLFSSSRIGYEPEYEHELDHLLGLDGWGSGN